MLYYFINNVHVDYVELLWEGLHHSLEHPSTLIPYPRVDVPTTQSQPIESTQGTHRTPGTPRTPNPEVSKGESTAQQKSTVIRLHILQRRSTRLTPPSPIPTAAEVEDMTVQDTIQLSIAEQKSRDS
ncbi:hypothetical protein Tco_1189626 [Tanacetum coccineum]